METEEMMENEEAVVNAAEEVSSDMNVWKFIVEAGVIGVAGYFGYKYVAKPIMAKIKEKKEQNKPDFEAKEQRVTVDLEVSDDGEESD